MGDNRFFPCGKATFSELPMRPPSTDLVACDPLTADPIEDTPSFVGSLETDISATSYCRASPPVVGRTTSTTLTTSVLDYMSPVTSKTGIEPVDSGFSSWTVTAEPNPHFSPTLMRLDSEGHQNQNESQTHIYADSRPTNGVTALNTLSCANALDEELCDRMFMTNLDAPSSSCPLNNPIPSLPCSSSWLTDDNNDEQHCQEPVVRTNTATDSWGQTELTEETSLFYPDRAQSPFRPVDFFEIKFFDSTNMYAVQHHDTLPRQPFDLPTRSAAVVPDISPHSPQSSVSKSAGDDFATFSVTACGCRRFRNRNRPGSAPMKIAHGSIAHTQSVDVTDDEQTGNTDDASIDTANDGDDEGDSCTPTLRRRRRRKQQQQQQQQYQQQQRSRCLRYSHSGIVPSCPSIVPRTAVPRHCETQSGLGDLNGTVGTHPRVADSYTINSDVSATPNSTYYPHHIASHAGFRTDPLWLRRRRFPPLQTLNVGRSVGQRHSIHGQSNFTPSYYDSCVVPGAITSPLTIPSMPDVVPRENRVRLRSFCDGSMSPSSSTLFAAFPTAAALYRPPPMQRIDSVRNQQTTRCASVPIVSVESPGPYATSDHGHQHTGLPDNILSRCSVHCDVTRYHHHHRPIGGVSQSMSGPLLSDSVVPGGHDQLSLFAQRMAFIGDELVAQRRLRTRTRYSLPADSFFNGVRSAAHTAHSLWSLSSSFASLMTVPLDYMHRIVQLASSSLSGGSTRATNSPVPVDERLSTSGRVRRRAQTYAGGPTRPRVGDHTYTHAVPRCAHALTSSPVRWTVQTSTPTHGRSRQALSTDSSVPLQTSPTDEVRNTEYIFHFENE